MNGFPVEQRLKNLIEQVADLESQNFYSHPSEDVVFTGVVTAIKSTNSTNYYLVVAPLVPANVLQDGTLIVDNGSHPLASVPSTTHLDRVYALNVPPGLLGLYFKVGQRVKYWRWSGAGTYQPTVSGTYATLVDDLSFFARIDWRCTCGSTGGSTGSGSGSCIVHPDPSNTSGPVAWKYNFTAYEWNPSATSLDQTWFAYNDEGVGLTGVAYNLAEVLNTTGAGENPTGSGVDVDDHGYRYDDQTSEEKIVPLGSQIVRVYPQVNPSANVCNFTQYFFLPITNQFADQNTNPTDCCPSSSSNSSSGTGCCPCYEIKAYAANNDTNYDLILNKTNANTYMGSGATLTQDGQVWYLQTPDGSVFQSAASPCPPSDLTQWTNIVPDAVLISVNCCGSSSSNSSGSISMSHSVSTSGSASNPSTSGGGGSTGTNCDCPISLSVSTSGCVLTITMTVGSQTTTATAMIPCCCGSTSTSTNTSNSNSSTSDSNSSGSGSSGSHSQSGSTNGGGGGGGGGSGSNLSVSISDSSSSNSSGSSSSSNAELYWIWYDTLNCGTGSFGLYEFVDSVPSIPYNTNGIQMPVGGWSQYSTYFDNGGTQNCVYYYIAGPSATMPTAPANPTDGSSCNCPPPNNSSSSSSHSNPLP